VYLVVSLTIEMNVCSNDSPAQTQDEVLSYIVREFSILDEVCRTHQATLHKVKLKQVFTLLPNHSTGVIDSTQT